MSSAEISNHQKLLEILGDVVIHVRHKLSDNERPITVRALSRMTGISQATLSQVEKGRKPPGRRVMCKFSAYLNEQEMYAYCQMMNLHDEQTITDAKLIEVRERVVRVFTCRG